MNVPPDASVWVGVLEAGDDVTLYDVAPVDAGHVRSIVVVLGLLGVTLATDGESVYTAAVVAVIVPNPDALIEVIVNVYWIPAVRPVNMYAPPTGDVCGDVATAGDEAIEYDVAPSASVHAIPMVVCWAPSATASVTAGDRVIFVTLEVPPSPDALVAST
jgi:hypothetical protein